MTSPRDNNQGWKIFIGGIAPTTTQDMIQKYFEQYGELTDCVLMQDKTTGKSRGFGFVTYKDPKKADEVLSQTHTIDGKTVDCKRAKPRDQQGEPLKEDMSNIKTKKLFVGGLPQNLSLQIFTEYFEQFGKIEDLVIMMDKDTGKSRGFGFVTYEDEASVDKIIERYAENKIDGKWVECKKALPRDSEVSHKKQDSRHDHRHSRHHGKGRDRDRDRSDRDSRSRDSRDSYYDYDRNHQSSSQSRKNWNQQGTGWNDFANYQRHPSMQDNYGYYGTGYMQPPVPMQNNYDPYGMMGVQYPNSNYKNQGYPMMNYDPNMNQMQMGMHYGMPNQMGPGNMQGMGPMPNMGMTGAMPNSNAMQPNMSSGGMQPMNQNISGTPNEQPGAQSTMVQPNLNQAPNQSQVPIQSYQMPQNVQSGTQMPANMPNNMQGNPMVNQNLQSHYGNSPPQNMVANATNPMGSLPQQNQMPNQLYGSNQPDYSYQNPSYGNQQRTMSTSGQGYGSTAYGMNDRSSGPIKTKS